MSAAAGRPQIEIYNNQEGFPVDVERMRRIGGSALPICLQRAIGDKSVLAGLDSVEVSIVDDPAIAAVHGQFMDDPAPTDVITFDHGEILISADTAASRAAEFDITPERELALYLIHGLLHLAGYRDKSGFDFEQMRQVQEAVLVEVW